MSPIASRGSAANCKFANVVVLSFDKLAARTLVRSEKPQCGRFCWPGWGRRQLGPRRSTRAALPAFTCDSTTGKCTCQGPWESKDCQLMDKNCSKTGPVLHYCEGSPPFNCHCSMFAKKPPEKIQKGPGRAVQIAELADR
jgi:hypothetical protein